MAQALGPYTIPMLEAFPADVIFDEHIVDPEGRLIERWRPGDDRPGIHRETLEWQPVPDVPPLLVDVAGLFAEVPEPE